MWLQLGNSGEKARRGRLCKNDGGVGGGCMHASKHVRRSRQLYQVISTEEDEEENG